MEEIIIEFKLREIMNNRNMSVKDVSQMTGITRSGIYFMLDHLPRSIQYITLGQLCAGLEISPNDLFTVRKVRRK